MIDDADTVTVPMELEQIPPGREVEQIPPGPPSSKGGRTPPARRLPAPLCKRGVGGDLGLKPKATPICPSPPRCRPGAARWRRP